MPDLGLEIELSIRLAVAAGLGAIVGLERELHNHPAGMRTHILVSLGSALFAVVSAYGYADVFASDPSAINNPQRIAAQIVTGIGFLGAGAIIQSGHWVRGLTTAASLWATAAIGLAIGSGAYVLGVVGTVLVALSLGPLNGLMRRWRGRAQRIVRLRLELGNLEALGRATATLVAAGSEVTGLDTRRLGKGRYEADLALRLTGRVPTAQLIAELAAVPDVDVSDATDSTE